MMLRNAKKRIEEEEEKELAEAGPPLLLEQLISLSPTAPARESMETPQSHLSGMRMTRRR